MNFTQARPFILGNLLPYICPTATHWLPPCSGSLTCWDPGCYMAATTPVFSLSCLFFWGHCKDPFIPRSDAITSLWQRFYILINIKNRFAILTWPYTNLTMHHDSSVHPPHRALLVLMDINRYISGQHTERGRDLWKLFGSIKIPHCVKSKGPQLLEKMMLPTHRNFGWKQHWGEKLSQVTWSILQYIPCHGAVFSTKLPFISDGQRLAAFGKTKQEQINHT